MADPFNVPSSERGVIRVFTTDLDAEGNAAITPQNVYRLLGDGLELDPKHVEVFPSTVMEEMGLSSYLAEGYGIPESDLQPTSAKLDLLKGLVIIVSSGAFKGEGATLAPRDGIRFVGAFQEPGMAPPKTMAAPEAAAGRLESGGETPEPGRGVGAIWPIALLALLGAAVLILLLVL